MRLAGCTPALALAAGCSGSAQAGAMLVVSASGCVVGGRKQQLAGWSRCGALAGLTLCCWTDAGWTGASPSSEDHAQRWVRPGGPGLAAALVAKSTKDKINCVAAGIRGGGRPTRAQKAG
jgi:hypothetical protein